MVGILIALIGAANGNVYVAIAGLVVTGVGMYWDITGPRL